MKIRFEKYKRGTHEDVPPPKSVYNIPQFPIKTGDLGSIYSYEIVTRKKCRREGSCHSYYTEIAEYPEAEISQTLQAIFTDISINSVVINPLYRMEVKNENQ